MIDHGYLHAHARGNTGRPLRLGIVDVPPHDRHESRMEGLARAVVPDAEILWGEAAWDRPDELWRLAEAGCSSIALPFVFPGVDTGPRWRHYLAALRANGVLVFAGTGNGVPHTLYPASDPDVFACGGIGGDGSTVGTWSSRAGKRQVGAVAGDAGSSGATVLTAAMSVLWTVRAVYLYPDPAHRWAGYDEWLSRTGTPLPGGGYAPNCSGL